MFDNQVAWQKFVQQETSLIEPIGPAASEYIEMDVKIVPDWNISVYLEWTPPEFFGDVDVNYMIYSSASELGPFTNITVEPITSHTYFTTLALADSKVYEQFFTIESRLSTGETFRSYPATPSVSLPPWHILRHKDIIRRESILLDKFTGVDTIIFTPRRSGKRCTACWDPFHKKVMDDHCETCYGTSYEGGYNTGMRTKVQYSSIDPQRQFNYQGVEEPTTISGWTISIPLVMPQAILLRLDDRKVFRCEGHQGSTEMLTNMQRQNFILRELGRDSIENRLFNSIDVIDIMPRPPHIHT